MNGSKSEFRVFNLLPSGWLKKKYPKLSLVRPADSKN